MHKDDIEDAAKALYNRWSGYAGWVPWVEGGNSLMQDEARRSARAVIAAHTAKVLEDVEPVAWMGVSGVGERIVSKTQIYPFLTTPLSPAHTVAALAARVAELEGVIDSVLLDIDDDGVAEAQDIAILAMRNIRNGRPQYEGLDAALAAKGQA